ncbi:MAG: TetR/AcrR family transcriptional regulator [Allosphingosinicella sp.]
MDAAESLFIRLGYDGTSIRAISSRAKVNLGTVVYHWGTKEALFREVLRRRFGDIIQEQLRRLRLCEQRWDILSGSDVEEVLRALVEPPLLLHSEPGTAETIRLLYGRALTDPSPIMTRITIEMFEEEGAPALFRKLLRRCVPAMDDETFYRRYTCALGAFVFTQSFGDRVAQVVKMDDLQANWSEVANEIVGFIRAGLEHR